MTINTKRVTGRRTLAFSHLDQLLPDAQRLAADGYRSLGNWSLGQACGHLAASIHESIDGAGRRAPLLFRWLGPIVKRSILRKGMSPGFQLPKTAASLIPGPTEDQAGLAALRMALERLEREAHREPHPFFGALTNEEWELLHRRHAEMHFSFFLPNRPESAIPSP